MVQPAADYLVRENSFLQEEVKQLQELLRHKDSLYRQLLQDFHLPPSSFYAKVIANAQTQIASLNATVSAQSLSIKDLSAKVLFLEQLERIGNKQRQQQESVISPSSPRTWSVEGSGRESSSQQRWLTSADQRTLKASEFHQKVFQFVKDLSNQVQTLQKDIKNLQTVNLQLLYKQLFPAQVLTHSSQHRKQLFEHFLDLQASSLSVHQNQLEFSLSQKLEELRPLKLDMAYANMYRWYERFSKMDKQSVGAVKKKEEDGRKLANLFFQNKLLRQQLNSVNNNLLQLQNVNRLLLEKINQHSKPKLDSSTKSSKPVREERGEEPLVRCVRDVLGNRNIERVVSREKRPRRVEGSKEKSFKL